MSVEIKESLSGSFVKYSLALLQYCCNVLPYRGLRYRIYPTSDQEEKFLEIIDSCRWLYNFFLGIIKTCTEVPDRKILSEMIPALCRYRPELNNVHSKTRQCVLAQLYGNLSVLKVLKIKGHKVGALRFKGKGWYKSFVYNQSGFEIEQGAQQARRMGYLHLSKVKGGIPIRLHRIIPKEALIKQITVKHASSGKWYARVAIEYDQPISNEPLDYSKHVGLDVGVINYIYDSEGHNIPHPYNFQSALEELARAQRKLLQKQKGSRNRIKERIKVARLHERIANRRNDFLHKISAYYVKHYDVIGREDLSLLGLIRISRNARNLTDASFGRLFNMIAYKAEIACKLVVEVKARYTSIECSGCHEMVKKTLAVRIHHCPNCGLKIDRDYNASRIVDQRVLQFLGLEESELSKPVEMEPLLIRDSEQILSGKQELLQCVSGEAQKFRSG